MKYPLSGKFTVRDGRTGLPFDNPVTVGYMYYLISVTACHLIPLRDFSLLSNIATHYLIYTWRKIVTILRSEYFYINDNTLLPMRHTQRGITHFAGLFSEEYECDARDTKLGPEEITRDIPNVGEEVLKNLDERGIIRVGAEVRPGDILVPIFIRDGTPNGFNTISTGVPSSKNGISHSGKIRDTTPLFP